MHGEMKSPESTVEQIEGIPLYLVPRTIADQIKKKRETITCFEVREGARHYYTITVKTS